MAKLELERKPEILADASEIRRRVLAAACGLYANDHLKRGYYALAVSAGDGQ